MHGCRVDQPLVDELLRRRVLAAALPDGDLARVRASAIVSGCTSAS